MSPRSLVPLLLPFLLHLSGSAPVRAESREMLLWPEGAPGALGDEAKDRPKLILYLPEPEKAVGAAIAVCPGGGYGHLAMDHEGHQIAQWLNSFGVAAAIVDYRHRGKGYGHPAPLHDAQRAIRTLRANAESWHIDPARVGVLGFSAGGHLASTVVTHFDAGDPRAEDPIARHSSRPDFGILCYPVIVFGGEETHRGSQRNLLGEDADDELVQSLSNDRRVTKETPPCFLWHTNEDSGVVPENSVAFYLALRRSGVPAELHIYRQGRHGVGLGKGIIGTEAWPEQCRQWMEGLKLLKSDG